jgi:hypothetical protein
MPCNMLVLFAHFLKEPATSIFRVEDLTVEKEGSSETSISFYQTALRHVTEDRGLHIRHHKTSHLTAPFLFVLRRSVRRKVEVMTMIIGRLFALGHLVVRKMSGIRFKNFPKNISQVLKKTTKTEIRVESFQRKKHCVPCCAVLTRLRTISAVARLQFQGRLWNIRKWVRNVKPQRHS